MQSSVQNFRTFTIVSQVKVSLDFLSNQSFSAHVRPSSKATCLIFLAEVLPWPTAK